MRHRKRGPQPLNGINLTSMLDITFVLLIAFMVVAPALTQTMEVDVPKAASKSQTNTAKPPADLIVVSVEYGGRPEGPHPLFANKQPLDDLEELGEVAADWFADENPVALEIDRKVPYGIYVEVAMALQNAGIQKYQIIYRPDDNDE
jgi:biopolymer transport protein ExbD